MHTLQQPVTVRWLRVHEGCYLLVLLGSRKAERGGGREEFMECSWDDTKEITPQVFLGQQKYSTDLRIGLVVYGFNILECTKCSTLQISRIPGTRLEKSSLIEDHYKCHEKITWHTLADIEFSGRGWWSRGLSKMSKEKFASVSTKTNVCTGVV